MMIVQSVEAGVRWLNRLLHYIAAFLIVACSGVMLYEVLARYLFQVSNDWVIEFCIYLLIASTFLAAAHTQRERGHVGIELFDEILSKRVNKWRVWLGDVLSLLFCTVVAVLCWEYFYEAYDNGYESNSSWAPKLWIPYAFMALGMSLLSVELLFQTLRPGTGTKAGAH